MQLMTTELEEPRQTRSPSARIHYREDRPILGQVFKHVVGILLLAGLTCGCFQLSQRYVVQSVQVSGSSMAPTLADSNWYLLNRLVYRLRPPQPSEIVVLLDPEENCYAVKRIVAKPGDSVYLVGGQIFVNGLPLREPYLEPGTKTYPHPRYAAVFSICGQTQYFVLGDNRNQSADSRIYGAVHRQNILGLVSP